ncbi:hypothetical protein ABPG74_018671 [Tetrahymena malaccensis]
MGTINFHINFYEQQLYKYIKISLPLKLICLRQGRQNLIVKFRCIIKKYLLQCFDSQILNPLRENQIQQLIKHNKSNKRLIFIRLLQIDQIQTKQAKNKFMISPNQQQYVQLDNKVPGRACFLATNFINILVHTLIFFEVYHNIGSSIMFIHIFVAYLITHYVLGVVSAIDQNQQLHKFYKISCAAIGIIHLIVTTLCLICIIIMATKEQSGNTFFALVLVIYIMGLAWSGVELCVDYSNYKYINQLIAASSNQYLLGLPQSAQLPQNHFNQTVLPQQHQVQSCQPYVLHYPQQHQQVPQQNIMEYRQQPFAYPMTADIMNSQNSAHKQPLILQNSYPQLQQ